MNDNHKAPLPPGLLTEEVTLPVGVWWLDKLYPKVTVRAEQFGDAERVADYFLAQGVIEIDEEKEGVEMPVAQFGPTKLLIRIVKAQAEDGDELTGKTLRQALRNGLHPQDGRALEEADRRLGEKLPGASGSSAPAGPSKSASASSVTLGPRSGE